MGYMGFGMRKEVYTRKPKRSFEKIKELYGNDIPRVEESDGKYELKAEEILNKKRFRTLYDTKAFRYFLVIAV
ncbi:hypothetical protein [Fulvivirga ligni]|uniref:hypothetical protein n=1 Tax=Fulvivirga ligni TaxID=2904246 RepID=UPI001F3CA60F|nr:hypothetical protein [Fulvivirga ligni]UII23149.1 hypothetical protein LVD16_07910 [Fulvivirga ligni]